MWKILILDIQVTNLQQLCDVIMSDLRNISNTILNLFYEELKQLFKTKGVPTGTSKVGLINWPMNVNFLEFHLAIRIMFGITFFFFFLSEDLL